MTPNQTDLYATIASCGFKTQDHIHWDNCRGTEVILISGSY